jgi:hypothetical protein
MERLPPDSKTYAKLAYQAKGRWHQGQARMSFKKKLDVLDKMLEPGASPFKPGARRLTGISKKE